MISWHDNVPVFGWLMLRGKARCCGTKISPRYPFVELLTAMLFYALAVWPPFAPGLTSEGAVITEGMAAFVASCVFVSMLVALTFIDFDTQLLPDVLTKPGMVLGLAAGTWPGVAGVLIEDDVISPVICSALWAEALHVSADIRAACTGPSFFLWL